MKRDERDLAKQSSLIATNLKRAFDAQAAQELPAELIELIAKLNEQDLETKNSNC